MFKKMIMCAVVVGLILALAPAAQAGITEVVEPAGGYPAEGYRLIFVTSATTAATDNGIGYYN